MTTSYLSRLAISPEEGIKAPCVASTPVNITLSGEQTIDGVAVVAGDRVLVRSQTDATENGIYDVMTSAWTRSSDFNDSSDVVNGILVLDANSLNDIIYKAEFTGEYNPGVTEVTFSESVSSGLVTYTGPSGVQAEYEARGQYDVNYMDDLIGVDLTSFVVGETVLCNALNAGSPGTYSVWEKDSDGATAPDVATGLNTDGYWYSALTSATKFKQVRQTNCTNIAALKLIEGETDGQPMQLKGYYTAGDGGGGEFYWDATSTETDNGGTIIQATGITTGRWKRLYSGDLEPIMFGAKYDGTTDDTAAHAAAIATGEHVKLNSGSTVISETLVVPARQNFYGDGWNTVIVPATSGTWLNNFVISYNSTDASTWTVSTPGMPGGVIGKFRINNNSGDATTKGVFAAGSVRLPDIRGQGLAQVIKTSADYNDMVVIERPTATNPTGSEYQVEISNLGDGFRLTNYFCDDVTWPGTNALKITGCRGGEITSSIGGNYYFDNCEGLGFNGFHIETGVITINESRMSLSNGEIFENSSPRITISATNGDHHVTLDKVLFMRDITTNAIDFNEIDVVVSTRNALTVRDCYTKTLLPSNTSINELGGIIVGSDSSTILTDFTNFSYSMSTNGEIIRANKVTNSLVSFNAIAEGAFYPFVALATTSNVTWKAATATYYYRISYIYDADRQIGRTATDGERSLALTNASNGARLTVGGGRQQKALLRIYRGTSTGSYDEYVDIPLINMGLIYDNGETANGYKWKARVAGAVDTVYDCLSGKFDGGNIIVRKNTLTAPTAGTWVVGDQVLDAAPSASSFLGQVCVTAGTPGTWKTFGAISA